MDAKKSFILYTNYKEPISELSNEDAGKLLKAILSYADDGTLTDINGAAKMAFSFIKNDMDNNDKKYAETVRKRREAGKKSAEQRENKKTSVEHNEQNKQVSTSVENAEQNKQVSTDNVNVNDNDNVNVNEIEDVDENISIFKSYEQNIDTLSSKVCRKLASWKEDMPDELILLAIEEAVSQNKKSYAYINAILESWKEQGFKNIDDVKKHQENYKRKNKKGLNNYSENRSLSDFEKQMLERRINGN